MTILEKRNGEWVDVGGAPPTTVSNTIGGTPEAPTLTTTVNGVSSTPVNLPAGGGKPTDISFTTIQGIIDNVKDMKIGDELYLDSNLKTSSGTFRIESSYMKLAKIGGSGMDITFVGSGYISSGNNSGIPYQIKVSRDYNTVDLFYLFASKGSRIEIPLTQSVYFGLIRKY